MCGIVGLISRTKTGFYQDQVELLKQMLVMDGLFRGEDSTGVYQIQRNRQLFSTKLASHAYHLFQTDEWTDFARRMTQSSRIVIGHNRKATQGAINSENAHPFHENHITLVHNGTLRGHKKLADVDVDSHAVARAFSERPAESVLKELDGAFCFIWYDASAERLFVVRNKERPMNLIKTANFYVLASEAWMAGVPLKRKNITIEETIELKVDTLYSFDLNGDYTEKPVELQKESNTNAHWDDYLNRKYPLTNPNPVTQNSRWPYPERSAHQRNVPQKDSAQELPFRESTKVIGEVSESTSCGSSCDLRSDSLEDDEEDLLRMGLGLNRPRGGVVSLFPTASAYKSGELVMVKLTSIENIGHGKTKASGHTLEPGRANVDVLTSLPLNTPVQKWGDYYDPYVLCKVTKVLESNCGPTLQCETAILEHMFETHNSEIGSAEWAWVCDNETCGECGGHLKAEDHTFTSIKRTGTSLNASYRITCPDCVQAKLFESNRELHDSFEQRRIDAVQDGQSIGNILSHEADLADGAARTETLH